MALHDEFLGEIRSLTKKLLSGEKPDWKTFVKRFGTHYAHAITQGRIDLVQTRFSLEAESKATTTTAGLNGAAKAVVEGVKAGGQFEVTAESYKKLGLEMSQEDVFSLSIGHDTPVGIFYDLRPVTELLSPVFFPYRPLEPSGWGALAPWVWHGLRPSLAGYLQELGLNKPLEADAYIDYTPRRYKVTIENITVSPPPPKLRHVDPGRVYVQVAESASVKVSPVPAHQPDVSCLALESKDWRQVGHSGTSGVTLSSGYRPDPADVYWTMAAKGGQTSLPLRVAVALPTGYWSEMSMDTSGPTFEFQRDVVVDTTATVDSQDRRVAVRSVEVSEAKSGFALTIGLRVEDVGPFV
jgi:hypothetical protein